MKLSTRGRYGVRAMLELALCHDGAPTPLNHISRRQGISAKYLEQLLIPLKAAGLVSSMRGARGGYLLARQPADINLSEIVSVLEGPLVVADCVCNPESCERSDDCAVCLVWGEMSSIMQDFLQNITLAQLVERAKAVECANRPTPA